MPFLDSGYPVGLHVDKVQDDKSIWLQNSAGSSEKCPRIGNVLKNIEDEEHVNGLFFIRERFKSAVVYLNVILVLGVFDKARREIAPGGPVAIQPGNIQKCSGCGAHF